MKNRKITRLAAIVLSVFVAFGMLTVFTEKAQADSRYQAHIDAMIHVGEDGYASAYEVNTESILKVVSLKSSNKKVAKVKKTTMYDTNGKKYKSFYFVGVKPGTAKLTMKYKLPGGKTKTVKQKVSVLAYPNQIESLTVNGKNVQISKAQRYNYSVRNKKTSATVALKLKEGWTVKFVSGSYYNYKTSKDKTIKGLKAKIMNGGKIDFPKKWTNLNMSIEMTNGTDTIWYYIGMYR